MKKNYLHPLINVEFLQSVDTVRTSQEWAGVPLDLHGLSNSIVSIEEDI